MNTNRPEETSPSVHKLPIVSTGAKFTKQDLAVREGLRIVRLVVPAGVDVPEHHSTVDVVATVVRGSGTFTVEGAVRAINAGSVVEMQPKVRHSLHAVEDLELVVVHCRVAAAGAAAHCGA